MEWKKTAKELEGLHTVESVAGELGVSRRTAINYVYELRKRGFVHEESRGRKGKRFYRIKPWKSRDLGNPGLYETLNMYSPVKLAGPYRERVHGERLSVEKALVRAVESGEFRTVLASLALFRRIGDWMELYREAKKVGIGRKVGALYDLSRKFIPKTRAMDGRVRRMLKSKAANEGGRYIIRGIESGDFKDIRKEWNVRIPFSRGDMEVYG